MCGLGEERVVGSSVNPANGIYCLYARTEEAPTPWTYFIVRATTKEGGGQATTMTTTTTTTKGYLYNFETRRGIVLVGVRRERRLGTREEERAEGECQRNVLHWRSTMAEEMRVFPFGRDIIICSITVHETHNYRSPTSLENCVPY